MSSHDAPFVKFNAIFKMQPLDQSLHSKYIQVIHTGHVQCNQDVGTLLVPEDEIKFF